MAGGVNDYPILFDTRLVEDAVMLAEPTFHPLRRLRFRNERDGLYRTDDPEERDRTFGEFHREWFDRVGLGRPLTDALERRPIVMRSTRRCLILPARTAADEAADLRAEMPHTASRGEPVESVPSVLIMLRATTLVEPAVLVPFLDHELLHVSDILDSEFGYERDLAPVEGGPARDRTVRGRYRVLWDCTIDGRLHHEGRVPREVATVRRREFERWFPELGADTEREFARWFEGPRPTHPEILRAAGSIAPAAGSGICPLCRFPYAALHRDGEEIPHEALPGIRADYPSWDPLDGVCTPCIDLYRARALEQSSQAT